MHRSVSVTWANPIVASQWREKASCLRPKQRALVHCFPSSLLIRGWANIYYSNIIQIFFKFDSSSIQVFTQISVIFFKFPIRPIFTKKCLLFKAKFQCFVLMICICNPPANKSNKAVTRGNIWDYQQRAARVYWTYKWRQWWMGRLMDGRVDGWRMHDWTDGWLGGWMTR